MKTTLNHPVHGLVNVSEVRLESALNGLVLRVDYKDLPKEDALEHCSSRWIEPDRYVYCTEDKQQAYDKFEEMSKMKGDMQNTESKKS